MSHCENLYFIIIFEMKLSIEIWWRSIFALFLFLEFLLVRRLNGNGDDSHKKFSFVFVVIQIQFSILFSEKNIVEKSKKCRRKKKTRRSIPYFHLLFCIRGNFSAFHYQHFLSTTSINARQSGICTPSRSVAQSIADELFVICCSNFEHNSSGVGRRGRKDLEKKCAIPTPWMNGI